MRVWNDLESTWNFTGGNLSEWIIAFAEVVEDEGQLSGIYGGNYWFQGFTDQMKTAMARWPLWTPGMHAPHGPLNMIHGPHAVPAPWEWWSIHQWTGYPFAGREQLIGTSFPQGSNIDMNIVAPEVLRQLTTQTSWPPNFPPKPASALSSQEPVLESLPPEAGSAEANADTAASQGTPSDEGTAPNTNETPSS
jgi:hypothetical protein